MRVNKKDIASILIFVALIIVFIGTINNITTKTNGRELQIVRDAVRNKVRCADGTPFVRQIVGVGAHAFIFA